MTLILILNLIFGALVVGLVAYIARDTIQRRRRSRLANPLRPTATPVPEVRKASRTSPGKQVEAREPRTPLDVMVAWSARGGAIRGADAHDDGDLSTIVDRMLSPREAKDDAELPPGPEAAPAPARRTLPRLRLPRFRRSGGSGSP